MIAFTKSESEKRVAQWRRLVREFPWLWAVKSHWRPGFDDMMVTNTQDGIFKVLLDSSHPDTEVWVVRKFRDALGVDKVSYKPGLSVAETLAEVLHLNQEAEILHVVASSLLLREDGSRIYIIFRPKGGSDEIVNAIVSSVLEQK